MEYPDYIFIKAIATVLIIPSYGFLIGDRESKHIGMLLLISSIILFGFGFSVPQRIANAYKEVSFQCHLNSLKHSTLIKVVKVVNTNYLYELYLQDGTIIQYKTLAFKEKFASKYLANYCKDTIIYYPYTKGEKVTELINDRDHPNKNLKTDFYAKCIRNTTIVYKN